MKILITGIAGQDGVFLTKLLNEKHKNFEIIGISRNLSKTQFEKKAQANFDNLKILNTDLLNKNKVFNLVAEIEPNVVFNLSGPSSVYKSFKDPKIENEIKLIFNNLTDSLIENKIFCRFFQASSSEMYGLNNKEIIYSEKSSFIPNSPYANAKLENHNRVKELYENYDWNIFSGILFNHESEFRGSEYLIMKIINGAIDIKNQEKNYLQLGSLELKRDWSYAEEIVEGILEMTFYGKSFDYVLGSGKATSIKEIIDIIFRYFDLDYQQYIQIDKNILRENDPEIIVADPSKIKNDLGWSTKKEIEEFLHTIIKNYIKSKT